MWRSWGPALSLRGAWSFPKRPLPKGEKKRWSGFDSSVPQRMRKMHSEKKRNQFVLRKRGEETLHFPQSAHQRNGKQLAPVYK